MSTTSARVRLAHQDRGVGTPVVLLHGMTFDHTAWTPIVEKLGDDIRTVAIDLPGHGESPGPSCSPWASAARVNQTVAELGIEQPILVGHSMSAAIAGIYAASFPTRGLVHIDQPIEIRPFARMVRSLWPALSGTNFTGAFEPFRRSMGVDRVPEPLRSQVMESQDIRQDLVLGCWDELMRTDPDELQARIDEACSRITCPCLAVFGRALGPGDRLELIERIPHAEIEEWAEGGHLVHLVELDRFVRLLRGFIESCAATPV